jgi:putative peptide zinc metalloprotease protein
VVDEDAAGVMSGWRDGGFVEVSSHALQVLGVVLPLLGGLLIFGRITLRSSRGLARWSRGSASKRALAAALTAVVVTGLSWAWSQPGAYRPIVPGEDGRLTALLGTTAEGVPRPAPLEPATAAASATLPIGAAAERRLSSGVPLEATFPEGQTLPTKSEPQLAAVLVPSDNADTDAPPATDGSDEPWVFPFDQPLPPSEGDNQAAAYNTTDDSTKYDVAFALVWATGDEVLNVNEAHAYASCSNCVTVAVAFQVVLIMDDAQVVVPQNLAVAANYQCYRCITAAIANQLVLSVGDTPGQEQLFALGAVWNRLIEFGQSITSYSLAEISTQLEGFKAEIIAILDAAPPVEPSTAPGSTSPSSGDTTGGSSSEPSTSSPAPSEPSPSSEPAAPPSSEAPSDQTQPSSEPTSEPPAEQSTAPPPEPTAQDTSAPETSANSTTSLPSTTP